MDTLKQNKLNPRLGSLIQDIDLQSLSRIPSSRLEQTALPRIGLIELVSSSAFENEYQKLYLAMFHGGERERPDLIVRRLKDDFAGHRSGLAPYRVVGIRDTNGEPIAGAHFSVLMLAGGKYAIPYVQYIYVRPESRRHDMSEVLHTITLGIATADAKATGETRIVPFTLFETEPPNHGTSQSYRTNATERTTIHTKSGSRALMLRNKSGRITSCHVQPGLEPGDGPITLIWVTRPSPDASLARQSEVNEVGKILIAAYYRSLRDEGFPEKNIALAEGMAGRRCEGSEFVEVALGDVTRGMYVGLEGGVEMMGQNGIAVVPPPHGKELGRGDQMISVATRS